ncbi:MAG: triose-phosphate isomerase [Bdellovibrionota bacterium]
MKKIFAANWKLQKTPAQAKEFCETFRAQLLAHTYFWDHKEVFIFPQNFSLDTVVHATKDTPLFAGPQNIHTEKSGAFTGENSAVFAKEVGARTILLGHSERRQFFGETHEALNKKVKLCQELDLLPVFCIGETLAEREAGETEKICFEQITKALTGIDQSKRIIVAYEPVWAIGTGKVATVAQVQEIHEKLYHKMADLNFSNFQLLYGGSVKPDNAQELLQVPHVDGFLIGGAALEVDSFMKICSH